MSLSPRIAEVTRSAHLVRAVHRAGLAGNRVGYAYVRRRILLRRQLIVPSSRQLLIAELSPANATTDIGRPAMGW